MRQSTNLEGLMNVKVKVNMTELTKISFLFFPDKFVYSSGR